MGQEGAKRREMTDSLEGKTRQGAKRLTDGRNPSQDWKEQQELGWDQEQGQQQLLEQGWRQQTARGLLCSVQCPTFNGTK